MATDADFSVKDLLEWARTKPPHESYNFIDSKACALAQFGRATGREYLVGPSGSQIMGTVPGLDYALAAADSFGELVAELEKLCPQVPAPRSEWAAIGAYLTDLEMARS